MCFEAVRTHVKTPFQTLRVLVTTQSVETCIPTLEREERSSQLSCGAMHRMPFWTLRVLIDDAERRDLHSHAGA